MKQNEQVHLGEPLQNHITQYFIYKKDNIFAESTEGTFWFLACSRNEKNFCHIRHVGVRLGVHLNV